MSQPNHHEADNDDPQASSHPWDAHHDAMPDARYHFEICQIRSRTLLSSIMGAEEWTWRLLSPSGAALIECGGYADEDSCRAAVILLRDKAGSADFAEMKDLI